jgi:hypothetical protein
LDLRDLGHKKSQIIFANWFFYLPDSSGAILTTSKDRNLLTLIEGNQIWGCNMIDAVFFPWIISQ